MTQPVYTDAVELAVDKAVDLMERKHVRRLPVIDRNGRLVGIVSQTDLARQANVPAEEYVAVPAP